jgi:hypothetical protein
MRTVIQGPCDNVGFIGRFFPDDPLQFQSVPFSYRFETAKESLIDAAFVDINAVVLRLEKGVPDPEILARGLVYGSPIIDQVRACGGVEPEDRRCHGPRVSARIRHRPGPYAAAGDRDFRDKARFTLNQTGRVTASGCSQIRAQLAHNSE